MRQEKKRRLEAAGWKVGSTADFLGLTREEVALVETRMALARTLRDRRKNSDLTQKELARKLGSSQSRISQLEASGDDVSLDLILRALYAVGATRRDVATAIYQPHPPRAAARASGTRKRV